MKIHFTAIKSIIKSHTSEFFYEQSFMNYYFNLINFTDRSVFTSDNYILFPKNDTEYKINFFKKSIDQQALERAKVALVCFKKEEQLKYYPQLLDEFIKNNDIENSKK